MVPGEYACRVHDPKMAGLGNNSRSIIGKCVLLMFLVAVQVTGEGKKFIYEMYLSDILRIDSYYNGLILTLASNSVSWFLYGILPIRKI